MPKTTIKDMEKKQHGSVERKVVIPIPFGIGIFIVCKIGKHDCLCNFIAKMLS